MSDIYTKIQDLLTERGYQNPEIDQGDSRYRQIWKYIVDNDLEIKLENAKSIVFNLGDHSSKYFQYLQCRSDSESKEEVQELVRELFVENVRLRRLPIVLKIEEEYYVAVGNHRCRAMKQGYEVHKNSSFVGHVLVVDPNDKLSIFDKKNHGLAIAAKSNRQTKDQTRVETASDISHQLEMSFNLLLELDVSKYSKYSVEEKRSWASDWCKEFKKDTSQHTIVRAINKFESEEHGQSIPFPSDEELQLEWAKYWPNATFRPRSTPKLIQEKQATHYGNFQKKRMTEFQNRKEWTHVRPDMEVCVRAGETLDKVVESLEYISEQRDNYRENMKKWNRNENFDKAGFPMVKRILFVKQTNKGEYEAWEWESTADDGEGNFVKKQKI